MEFRTLTYTSKDSKMERKKDTSECLQVHDHHIHVSHTIITLTMSSESGGS